MLSLAPWVGGLRTPVVLPPNLRHPFKQESCPHLAEEETEAQRSREGGGLGPEHMPQASDSTSLRFAGPGVTLLHPRTCGICWGPSTPGRAFVPTPRPARLPQETTPGRGHSWGELAALCHPSFSVGFLRVTFPACFLKSEPRAAPLCCPLPSLSPLNRVATPHGSGQLSRGPRRPVPANTAHKANASPP